jgi:MerC mercury resistance protein
MASAFTSASTSRWDRAGIWISGACVVHCVLLPALATLVPAIRMGPVIDPRAEWALIAAAAIVGVVGHLRAYRRDHRRFAPCATFIAGLSLGLIGRLGFESGRFEPLALGVGGALAAASHYANLRLCRCCEPFVTDQVPRTKDQ